MYMIYSLCDIFLDADQKLCEPFADYMWCGKMEYYCQVVFLCITLMQWIIVINNV